MAVPLSYSFRNLWTRRLTTVLTASGMALVVYVFAATMMLGEGFRQTLVSTGSSDNAIAIRKAAGSEVQSGVDRLQAGIIESQPEVAIGQDGRPLCAKELVVLINMPKRETNKPANVVIRGVGSASLMLRPQVKLIVGRLPRPGAAEVMAGNSIARRFVGGGLGESIRFGMREWRVVGVFDAGTTGFNSEIWGDSEMMMQAFRRPVFSSVLFRLKDASSLPEVKRRLEGDPRLTVDLKRETVYYEEQSEAMARFLQILGAVLTVIFSLGAIIGATITMYAAVANRTAEIGTLRALGFQRRSILAAFLAEAVFLGLLGGLAGIAFASAMQLITISTMNWQTFSELAFSFRLTPAIMLKSVLFGLFMGGGGGLLPAVRASRLKIVDALRAD